MAPLRSAGTSAAARTASAIAASPYARATASADPLAMASAGVARMALSLMVGMIGVGMHDAAKPLARALMGLAHHLSPRQLSLLCTSMAEVELRRELPALLGRG